MEHRASCHVSWPHFNPRWQLSVEKSLAWGNYFSSQALAQRKYKTLRESLHPNNARDRGQRAGRERKWAWYSPSRLSQIQSHLAKHLTVLRSQESDRNKQQTKRKLMAHTRLIQIVVLRSWKTVLEILIEAVVANAVPEDLMGPDTHQDRRARSRWPLHPHFTPPHGARQGHKGKKGEDGCYRLSSRCKWLSFLSLAKACFSPPSRNVE